MSDLEGWIEERLATALKTATTDTHEFPRAVPDELRKLLAGQFQEARKAAEMDTIAATLISANRGKR